MSETTRNYTVAEAFKPITLNDVKKVAAKIIVGSTGTRRKKSWFERLMNRLGWYRSSEWYLIDSSKFRMGLDCGWTPAAISSNPSVER